MALVEMHAYMVAEKKEKGTCRELRRDMKVKALVKTLAYRLAEVKAKKVRTH